MDSGRTRHQSRLVFQYILLFCNMNPQPFLACWDALSVEPEIKKLHVGSS